MAATQSPQTLSSATYAKLSPHPYLLANLQPPDRGTTPPSRANGRQPTQARPPSINTASLTHAHGSAVVRTGDTTVICGVRGETLATSQIPNYRSPPSSSSSSSSSSLSSAATDTDTDTDTDELRDYDLLVPNVELATGCAPDFLPGVPPTTLAQTLSTRVYSLLHSARILDVRDLRIYQHQYHNRENSGHGSSSREGGGNGDDDESMGEAATDDSVEDMDTDTSHARKGEVKAYWVLYIDLLFISLDGNPFDAAWAAVLAALRDTKLPRARWDADREVVLCSRGPAPAASVPLSVSGLPVACTAAVFTARDRLKKQSRQSRRETGDSGGMAQQQFWMLVDPDRFEESLCDETVTVVVDRSAAGDDDDGETKILGISKSGGTVVGPEVLRGFVKVAEDRWREFKDAFQ